jgi:hypothetical protein
METKTYTTMDYDEWDSLVKKHFPLVNQYTVVADEELNNDSTQTYDNINRIDFVNSMKDEYQLTRFGKLIAGKWELYITRLLVEFFVWMGVLPEGNFIIEVSW